MKLKSLILGSVAAAGLSTAGFAADLGVLTSLDVCDELGLSGLTISSDTNCLQISGGVSYEFNWGDFRTEATVARTHDSNRAVSIGNAPTDWNSKVEAWLKFVGTASSDFGPAKAVIKLKSIEFTRVNRGELDAVAGVDTVVDNDGERDGVYIDEAYVSIGDSTVIMAGKKGSIANLGDDEPFNYLGLFGSDGIDGKGVGIDGDTTYLGGHVIQVVSDLGNGVSVGVGLENLNGSSDPLPLSAANAPFTHGTLVGVVSYAGENLTAHLTGAAFGILDGTVESWAVHAGATGTFDAFKVRGAIAYWDNVKFNGQTALGRKGIAAGVFGEQDLLNALVSVEGTFDLFKIALSGEVASVSGAVSYTDFGVGGSIGVTVTEGVSINLGARYFQDGLAVDASDDTFQVSAQLVAAVTETLKVTGEIGGYFGDAVTTATAGDNIYYGNVGLDWAPGGGFTSSVKGEVNSESAYKVTFKAAKSFE
ncbi:porin [Devosia lacusdianchii]|uniref:porin n=1 Tax=Devosia lacusdianchii TaxID=2917991 RepID=UPI001F06817F|nr:porin [Devosia sp. JXJ CY 41]